MARKTTPRWKVIENVVAAVERVRASVPGVEVIQRAQVPKSAFPSETRDVDVLVRIPVQGRVLQLAIEVKNEGRPIAEDELGTLLDIRNDLQVDRYCVVSTSGFTRTAQTKARRSGVELTTLEESDGSPFLARPPGELVQHRRIELLSVSAKGASRALDKLRGRQVDSLKVIDRNKLTQSLSTLIEREANALVASGRLEGSDGQEADWELTFTTEVQLVLDGEVLEKPISFDLRCRWHWDKVEDTRFELAGWIIATWEVRGPEGPLQLTSISVPVEGEPSQYQIHLVVGPARPTRKKIGEAAVATR